MALNKQKLIDDLKAAFDAPKSITGPKDPPGKQQDLQQQVLTQKLAEAIDAFIRGADVKGVKVDIAAGSPAPQVGSAHVE
jgi:hypothetical protein